MYSVTPQNASALFELPNQSFFKVPSTDSKGCDDHQLDGSVNNSNIQSQALDQRSLSSSSGQITEALSVIKSGSENMKSTLTGEYLTAALMDLNPEQ